MRTGLRAASRNTGLGIAFGIALAQALPGLLHSQTAAAPASQLPTVSFAFERPGVPVPKFTLTIHEDGSGSYRGEEAPPHSPYPGVSSPPQPIDREIMLSAATTHKIFALAHDSHLFTIHCASRARNLADTGKKTLSYQGPDGEGSCTYNYSDSKSVTDLTGMMLDLAGTLDEGRELDRLHRFDRLGLDAAINFLVQQVSEGHAPELCTIQASLRSIAADGNVLQRVRNKANALLASIPAEMQMQAGP